MSEKLKNKQKKVFEDLIRGEFFQYLKRRFKKSLSTDAFANELKLFLMRKKIEIHNNNMLGDIHGFAIVYMQRFDARSPEKHISDFLKAIKEHYLDFSMYVEGSSKLYGVGVKEQVIEDKESISGCQCCDTCQICNTCEMGI